MVGATVKTRRFGAALAVDVIASYRESFPLSKRFGVVSR
jgi:hypothetical protein